MKPISLVSKAIQFVTHHSPQILTGLGVVGVVLTCVLAIDGTEKSIEAKNELIKSMKDEEPTQRELAIAIIPNYIPMAVCVGGTVLCFMAANQILTRRNIVLTGLYSMSTAAIAEYREGIIQNFGKNALDKIRQGITRRILSDAENEEKRINPEMNSCFLNTGKGTSICYDSLSGRFFLTDYQDVRLAEVDINRDIVSDICRWASLNELYERIGLPTIGIGNSVGWNVDHMLKLHLSSRTMENGIDKCMVIEYDTMPIPYNASW